MSLRLKVAVAIPVSGPYETSPEEIIGPKVSDAGIVKDMIVDLTS